MHLAAVGHWVLPDQATSGRGGAIDQGVAAKSIGLSPKIGIREYSTLMSRV